jgi:hypothetical protein
MSPIDQRPFPGRLAPALAELQNGYVDGQRASELMDHLGLAWQVIFCGDPAQTHCGCSVVLVCLVRESEQPSVRCSVSFVVFFCKVSIST